MSYTLHATKTQLIKTSIVKYVDRQVKRRSHILTANSVALSEIPLTWATLVQHRHTPFWNQKDPRIENLLFSCASEGPISPPQ